MKISEKEFIKLIQAVERKELTAKAASRLSGYSYDHFVRVKEHYEAKGSSCFIHGLTGKRSNHSFPRKTIHTILKLYHKFFQEESFQVFYEELNDTYHIKISYTGLVRILNRNNIQSMYSFKRGKNPEHLIRPRRDYEGELVQLDATPYQWFSRIGNNSYYTLSGAIDDATSKITALYMTENECTYGYFACMQQMADRNELPRSVYTDRAGIFTKNPKVSMTIEEQIEWEKKEKIPTQWQRMCADLSIKQIIAHSPQAKGRVERMWRTIQGRLPFWIKKNNIKTPEELNGRIQEFIDYHNEKFAKAPHKAFKAFRDTPKDIHLILSAQEVKTVLNGGIIRFKGLRIKLNEKARVNDKVTLYINNHGLYSAIDGVFHEVSILNDYWSISEYATESLQKIIYEYMYKDMKERDLTLTA